MATPAKKKPSRKNRDQERLFNPGRLNVWFAATSTLLLLAWVVMLWKDYARPWKNYQKDYYAALIRIEDAAESQVRRATTTDEQIAAYVGDLDARILAEQGRRESEGVNARIAELEQKIYDTSRDAKQSDAAFKGIKGDHAVAKYQFEMARKRLRDLRRRGASEGDIDAQSEVVEDKRAVLNNLAGQWYELKRESENLIVQVQQYKLQVAELEAPLKELQRAREAVLQDVEKQKLKVSGLKQKYARNQWRNAPFIDFISPTIKIQQVVLDDIHDNWNFATNRKVDRCTTCHLGIAMPTMADPDVTGNPEFGVEDYMRAHPHLDVIAGTTSPHPVEKFGCSVCHHGVGWATDFSRAAHQPATAEQKAQWKEDHGWYKAKYIDYPMQQNEYVQGQCFKCHKKGIFEPVHYPETLDHGYVEDNAEYGVFAQRAEINDPTAPGFGDAEANPVLPPNQVYGKWQLPDAPVPVDGSQEQVAQATKAWLAEHMKGPVSEGGNYHDGFISTRGWRAEKYDLGYDAVVKYGCQGCHKIADFGDQVGYEAPPKVGPNLTYGGDKLKSSFMPRWIRAPETYRIDTKMPAFYYFVEKDAYWRPVLDEQGAPRVWSVRDAHMTDPNPELGANYSHLLGVQSTDEDHARNEVEILAMSTYLLNQRNPATGKRWSRMEPTDPNYDPVYEVEPPEGDKAEGRKLVNSLGCMACHMVPEVETLAGFGPDDPARFNYDPLLMRGPRLMNLGSKIKSRRWFNAWLLNPRHYTEHSLMPNMRIDDLIDPLSGEVLRSGAQRRADIIDYLMSFEDEAFDAQPDPAYRPEYEPIVSDMWEEFFNKTPSGLAKRPDVVAGELGSLTEPGNLARVMARLGERLMARKGCYGCHNVAGHEKEQPIGVELSNHGLKDIHQLDFGRVPKYAKLKVKDEQTGEIIKKKVDVLPHTRDRFFRTKVTYPRIYDYSKQVRWTDKLRMPRFNFRMDDDLQQPKLEIPLAQYDPDNPEHHEIRATRSAVVAIVLGLVNEPIKPGAIYEPDEYEADIIAGRKVVNHYGCKNCHTIEGKQGFLWGWLKEERKLTPGALPPNLFTQGWRSRDEWLSKFLHEPVYLRPLVEVHMPKFGMNDAEILALVKYFKRLGGRDRGMGTYQPGSRLADLVYDEPIALTCKQDNVDLGVVRDGVEEAEALFNRINCNKCHLPKGWPGLAEGDGGVAPSFEHSEERLRHQWVRALLDNPLHLIDGANMPNVYGLKRKGGRDCTLEKQAFQFHLRDDPRWLALYNSDDPEKQAQAETELAEVQMDALTDYVLYHYSPPKPPTEGPAPAEGR
jgi:cytochrome c551/c552